MSLWFKFGVTLLPVWCQFGVSLVSLYSCIHIYSYKKGNSKLTLNWYQTDTKLTLDKCQFTSNWHQTDTWQVSVYIKLTLNWHLKSACLHQNYTKLTLICLKTISQICQKLTCLWLLPLNRKLLTMVPSLVSGTWPSEIAVGQCEEPRCYLVQDSCGVT